MVFPASGRPVVVHDLFGLDFGPISHSRDLPAFAVQDQHSSGIFLGNFAGVRCNKPSVSVYFGRVLASFGSWGALGRSQGVSLQTSSMVSRWLSAYDRCGLLLVFDPLWDRGILAAHAGTDAKNVRWRCGSLEAAAW